MSRDSLMGKFEALMRKHRGGAEEVLAQPLPTERQAPSPDAWLPVLTDVVKRGSPPDAAVEQARPAAALKAHETVVADEGIAPPMAVPELEIAVPVEPSVEPASVSEPLLAQEPAPETATESPDAQVAASLANELAPKITGLMLEQVAEELHKNLNQSMANLMANLNANVEEIVRQAVAETLAGKDTKSS